MGGVDAGGLEIAAGTGVLTRELAAAIPQAQVTATDLKRRWLSSGHAMRQRRGWQQADAQRLPLRRGGSTWPCASSA